MYRYLTFIAFTKTVVKKYFERRFGKLFSLARSKDFQMKSDNN